MPVPVTNLDFGNNSRALNLLNPTNPQDAATKIYVDNSVTNISNGMIVVNEFTALTTNTGNWAPNDVLIRFQITNNAGAISSTIWYTSNGTTLATIPVVGIDCEDVDKTLIGKFKNGSQSLASALSVTLARKTTILNTAASTAANLNLLDTTGTGAATDVRDYNTGSITVTPTNGTITYTIQGSVDAAFTDPYNINIYGVDGTLYVGQLASSGSSFKFVFSLAEWNYLRINIASAAVGNMVSLIANSALFVVPRNVITQSPGTTFSINQFAPSFSNDAFATATIGSTTTTNSPTISFGLSCVIQIVVNGISGTGATMAVVVQDTLDNGNNWRTIYTFPNIIAVGSYTSPSLPTVGSQLRYVQTVSGTSPAISRAIYRVPSNIPILISIAPKRAGGFNAANGGFDLSTQGRVRRIIANNRTATQLFLQIHDSATALATGAVPSAGEVYQLNTNSTIVLSEFGEFGTTLGTNPRIAISSTYGTYTLPPALAVNTVSLFVEAL